MIANVLTGEERDEAEGVIRKTHYTHSVPSGKSHYIRFGSAIVVWSIPANKNLGRFILPLWNCKAWELSRLWAPDKHEPNLLTQAISAAIAELQSLEQGVDILVSYADPNAGHKGGVYRAASWVYHGKSEEVRAYLKDGQCVARRKFHSGKRGMTKKEIEALGFIELRLPGKERFVKPVSRRARKFYRDAARSEIALVERRKLADQNLREALDLLKADKEQP
ncbi:MAG: hypothetical protein KKB31_08035 [Nanoarchaeota archaeon]|nr:hypothetical protein [Nanoarchaeota archaeon]